MITNLVEGDVGRVGFCVVAEGHREGVAVRLHLKEERKHGGYMGQEEVRCEG